MVGLRVTEVEKKDIETKARDLGLTVSTFLRLILAHSEVKLTVKEKR